MADEVDRANDLAQRFIDDLVAAAMSQNHPEAKPTGQCLWCGEPLPKGVRWCNAECRDVWEYFCR